MLYEFTSTFGFVFHYNTMLLITESAVHAFCTTVKFWIIETLFCNHHMRWYLLNQESIWQKNSIVATKLKNHIKVTNEFDLFFMYVFIFFLLSVIYIYSNQYRPSCMKTKNLCSKLLVIFLREGAKNRTKISGKYIPKVFLF